MRFAVVSCKSTQSLPTGSHQTSSQSHKGLRPPPQTSSSCKYTDMQHEKLYFSVSHFPFCYCFYSVVAFREAWKRQKAQFKETFAQSSNTFHWLQIKVYSKCAELPPGKWLTLHFDFVGYWNAKCNNFPVTELQYYIADFNV